MTFGRVQVRRAKRATFDLFGATFRWEIYYGMGWVASFNTWEDAFFFARLLVRMRTPGPVVILPKERADYVAELGGLARGTKAESAP